MSIIKKLQEWSEHWAKKAEATGEKNKEYANAIEKEKAYRKNIKEERALRKGKPPMK